MMGSPFSVPLTPEGDVSDLLPSTHESKPHRPFQSRKLLNPSTDMTTVYELDLSTQPSCEVDLSLRWIAQTQGPITHPPVATLLGDVSASKHVFVTSQTGTLEQLRGDGSRPSGWPISLENAVSFSSPLVLDVDGDGKLEVAVVDSDANLHCVRTGEDGKYLEDFHVQVMLIRSSVWCWPRIC
jgi:hypothetical protein